MNAHIKDGSPISELMTIFTEVDAYDDGRFPVTSGGKRYFKEDERGVREMCAIMQEIKEEGREEGRYGLAIQQYRSGLLSLEQICMFLNCTPENFLEKARNSEEQ